VTHASESLHFYWQDGRPCYEVRGANGQMRPTTLRDARKFALVPGYSSIEAMESKPQLTNWQIEQALMSALTLPRLANETDDDFIHRAREDSKEQARKAAARGTAIHAAIQGAFEGKPVAAEDLPYVEPVRAWLLQRYGLDGWSAETSFASPLGYGGKADLLNRGIPCVADIKCKDFGEEKQGKDLAWPNHAMQLAAYSEGFNLDPKGVAWVDHINIFVSTRIPGLIRVREWDTNEVEENWQAFICLLRLWKIRKKYNPAFERKAA
jgi:hypothetical protein